MSRFRAKMQAYVSSRANLSVAENGKCMISHDRQCKFMCRSTLGLIVTIDVAEETLNQAKTRSETANVFLDRQGY